MLALAQGAANTAVIARSPGPVLSQGLPRRSAQVRGHANLSHARAAAAVRIATVLCADFQVADVGADDRGGLQCPTCAVHVGRRPL